MNTRSDELHYFEISILRSGTSSAVAECNRSDGGSRFWLFSAARWVQILVFLGNWEPTGTRLQAPSLNSKLLHDTFCGLCGIAEAFHYHRNLTSVCCLCSHRRLLLVANTLEETDRMRWAWLMQATDNERWTLHHLWANTCECFTYFQLQNVRTTPKP